MTDFTSYPLRPYMEIQRLPIQSLMPADYNPRKNLQPGDPEYTRIKASLDRWGLVIPLIWNRRTGRLVSGHQRLKILQADGATHVDTSVVDVDETEEKAMNVAFNKLGEDGWDEAALAEVLTTLQNVPDLAFPLEVTGFAPGDVETFLRDLSLPMFEPHTEPEINAHVVTDAEVERTRERMETRFTQEREVREVICPHCGQGFAVDQLH